MLLAVSTTIVASFANLAQAFWSDAVAGDRDDRTQNGPVNMAGEDDLVAHCWSRSVSNHPANHFQLPCSCRV